MKSQIYRIQEFKYDFKMTLDPLMYSWDFFHLGLQLTSPLDGILCYVPKGGGKKKTMCAWQTEIAVPEMWW